MLADSYNQKKITICQQLYRNNLKGDSEFLLPKIIDAFLASALIYPTAVAMLCLRLLLWLLLHK